MPATAMLVPDADGVEPLPESHRRLAALKAERSNLREQLAQLSARRRKLQEIETDAAAAQAEASVIAAGATEALRAWIAAGAEGEKPIVDVPAQQKADAKIAAARAQAAAIQPILAEIDAEEKALGKRCDPLEIEIASAARDILIENAQAAAHHLGLMVTAFRQAIIENLSFRQWLFDRGRDLWRLDESVGREWALLAEHFPEPPPPLISRFDVEAAIPTWDERFAALEKDQ